MFGVDQCMFYLNFSSSSAIVISLSFARTSEMDRVKEMVMINAARCHSMGRDAFISPEMHASVFPKSRQAKLFSPLFASEWYGTGPK